jgi:hypothetical protein
VTGGCDEGCDSYAFAAVLDAATGEEVQGFGVRDAVALTDVDGLTVALRWKRKPAAPRTGVDAAGAAARRGRAAGGAGGIGAAAAGVVDSTALAGRRVRLRIYFRDATVYAVGAGGAE